MYYNIKFPLQDDTVNGDWVKRTENISDSIKSNLMFLLVTDKGSRFYNRGYGTNLKKFLFEQNDGLTEFDIETEIKTVISKNIPNLTINQMKFSNIENNKGVQLFIHFTYKEDFYELSDSIIIQF